MDQATLYEHVKSIDNPNYIKSIVPNGGILFIPLDEERYPLLCTHLDTINDFNDRPAPSIVDILIDGDTLSLNPYSSCSCLGGDDRCGVYTALKLMNSNVPYAFGFFLDEEIGGVGSDKIGISSVMPYENITAFIGLDRRGKDQAALYGYDNAKLLNVFEQEGYKSVYGTFTDASNLAKYWDIACINLSVGYYNEHTTLETINFKETKSTLRMLLEPRVIEELLDNTFTYDNNFQDELFWDIKGDYNE